MHAKDSYAVDGVLAPGLLVSGVIAVPAGRQIRMKPKAEQLRVLLAPMGLVMCLKLAIRLVLAPGEGFNRAS